MGELQPPNTTLHMMRPGEDVKKPAITGAPEKMPIMVQRWPPHVMGRACHHAERQHHQREDRQQVDQAPGAPDAVGRGLQEALSATISVSVTHA